MAAEQQPDDESRPARLGRAIRDAPPAFVDEIVLFMGANLAWVLVVGAFTLLWYGFPWLLLLSPVLALPSASLMRLAVTSARGGVPNLAMARSELGRLAGRKVLLAAVQLVLIGLGAANVALAGRIGGIGGIASALVAGYAVIGAWVYSIALWPIVCDPRREGRLRDQLRLATALLVTRPLQLGVLGLIAGLSVAVSIQLIAPALFLPCLVLLAIAGYVVPAADGLVPPPD